LKLNTYILSPTSAHKSANLISPLSSSLDGFLRKIVILFYCISVESVLKTAASSNATFLQKTKTNMKVKKNNPLNPAVSSTKFIKYSTLQV